MEGRVQVISREIVKPSSQIPHRLEKLKLSYLDQLVPHVYIPFIFFYQADESKGLTASNHVRISQQMKQSLSHTLPSFYPLAGRDINDDRSIIVDCNDAGVEFVDARVDARLMDVLQDHDLEEMKQYLPLDYTKVVPSQGRSLLLVQITFFNCGGVALGACFSHTVADFASIMAFFTAWGATCRGDDEAEILRKSFTFGETATYFPPSWIISTFFSSLFDKFLAVSNEKLITKRFVFDKEKLALLKQLVATSSSPSPSESSSLIIKDPSRVELVSAFIWKNFIETANFKNPEAKRIFGAFHAVNLRRRTSPPHLLENVFGNCITTATAIYDQYEGVEVLRDLVSKLRSAIRRITPDYITKPLNKESFWKDIFKLIFLRIMKGGAMEWCTFSSWCGFPVYEVDYGWGKPIRFSPPANPFQNLILLVSSRSGDGIEAIVTMTQDNLEMLETQINKLNPTNLND